MFDESNLDKEKANVSSNRIDFYQAEACRNYYRI